LNETHPIKGEFVMCIAGAAPAEGDKKKRKYEDEDE
jgi:16S rRNA (cytidine1402-2'-O)-methyltransferase